MSVEGGCYLHDSIRPSPSCMTTVDVDAFPLLFSQLVHHLVMYALLHQLVARLNGTSRQLLKLANEAVKQETLTAYYSGS